jgi:hypothetical protein
MSVNQAEWGGVPWRRLSWVEVARLTRRRLGATTAVVAVGLILIMLVPVGASSIGVRAALAILILPTLLLSLIRSARSRLRGEVVGKPTQRDSWRVALGYELSDEAHVVVDAGQLAVLDRGVVRGVDSAVLLVSPSLVAIGLEVALPTGSRTSLPLFGRKQTW